MHILVLVAGLDLIEDEMQQGLNLATRELTAALPRTSARGNAWESPWSPPDISQYIKHRLAGQGVSNKPCSIFYKQAKKRFVLQTRKPVR